MATPPTRPDFAVDGILLALGFIAFNQRFRPHVRYALVANFIRLLNPDAESSSGRKQAPRWARTSSTAAA